MKHDIVFVRNSKHLTSILGFFCGKNSLLAAAEYLVGSGTVPRVDAAGCGDDQMVACWKSERL